MKIYFIKSSADIEISFRHVAPIVESNRRILLLLSAIMDNNQLIFKIVNPRCDIVLFRIDVYHFSIVRITCKNQGECLILGLLGIVLMLIMTLSCHVYAQTSKSIVNQRGSSEGYIPYIKVGHAPNDIAINPDTSKIYVANYQSDSVSVIDLKTMDKKDIIVGAYPSQIVINPDTNTIYILNSQSKTVSVIDGNTDTKKVSDIPVGGSPHYMMLDPDTNEIFVTIEGAVRKISTVICSNNTCLPTRYTIHEDGVSVIDVHTNIKVRTISLGYTPGYITSISDDSGNPIIAASNVRGNISLFSAIPAIINSNSTHTYVGNVTLPFPLTSIVAVNPHTIRNNLLYEVYYRVPC
jgi:YVTN family beta-propeller protein